ncbi:MAG: porin [Planctomycetota bacterium]|nr:porin [Planctomycetota bacterium]
MNTTLIAATTTASCLAVSGAVLAQSTTDDLAREVAALRDAMAAQDARHDAEIAAIRDEQGEDWLTEERAAQVREVVQDVLTDSETRTNWQGTAATAGWDPKRGFYVGSADGNFELRVVGQMQWRYVYQSVSGEGADSSQDGFTLGNAKVALKGFVIDPTLQYEVQGAFSRLGGAFQLGNAYIRKDLGDGMALQVGQFKDRGVYEEFTSSSRQQFVDRSIVTRYFTTKRIMGLAWEWTGDNLRTYLSYNDGGNSANTSIANQPCDWAASGRVDWLAAGDWKQFGEVMSFRGSDLAIMAGAAIHYEEARAYTDSTAGVDGTADNLSWVADLNLRGGGWSVLASYYGNQSEFGGGVTPTANGVLLQGGYFITDRVEVVGNWQWVGVSSDGSTSDSTFASQRFWITTFGINYYLDGNRLKFQLDGGWSNGPILFSRGVYGDGIAGADWIADEQEDTEVVIQAAVQLLF